jgi:hypothetical protein
MDAIQCFVITSVSSTSRYVHVTIRPDRSESPRLQPVLNTGASIALGVPTRDSSLYGERVRTVDRA